MALCIREDEVVRGERGNPEEHSSSTVPVKQRLKQAETPDALRKDRNQGTSPLEHRYEMRPVFTDGAAMFFFPDGETVK